MIAALAATAGALIYLPFFWLRWRSFKRKHAGVTAYRITGAGLLFCGAMVVVLFAGLAIGTLYPQSWFGAQVRTLFGGLGYTTFVVILASIVERVLVSRGGMFWVIPSPDRSFRGPVSFCGSPEGSDARQPGREGDA